MIIHSNISAEEYIVNYPTANKDKSIINVQQISECPICCEKIEIRMFYTCKHCLYMICNDCYIQYLKYNFKKCPHCRIMITSNSNTNTDDIEAGTVVTHDNIYVSTRNDTNTLQFQQRRRNAKFLCCYEIFLVLLILSLAWGLGYGLTNEKRPEYQIINMLLGMILLSIIGQCFYHTCSINRR